MAAVFVRQGRQLGDALVEVVETHQLVQLVLGHQAGQAIGAKQQPVALANVQFEEIRVRVPGPVEDLQDQRPVRVGGSLLWRDATFVDE